MKKIVAAIILSFPTISLGADIAEEAKKAIDLQISEYRDKGVSGYIAAMAKTNPMISDKTIESQMLGSMTSVEGMCGKATGYSIKVISKLTEESANALFVINLERCPLFVRQVFYKSKAGQITSPNFYFHT